MASALVINNLYFRLFYFYEALVLKSSKKRMQLF